jgi:hypothetical protein
MPTYSSLLELGRALMVPYKGVSKGREDPSLEATWLGMVMVR